MLDTVFGPVISDEDWRAGLNFYMNCLRDVDRSIEIVLDALAASGQADRTMVILTADHGEMAGRTGSPGLLGAATRLPDRSHLTASPAASGCLAWQVTFDPVPYRYGCVSVSADSPRGEI
jgi:hypothetical protein